MGRTRPRASGRDGAARQHRGRCSHAAHWCACRRRCRGRRGACCAAQDAACQRAGVHGCERHGGGGEDRRAARGRLGQRRRPGSCQPRGGWPGKSSRGGSCSNRSRHCRRRSTECGPAKRGSTRCGDSWCRPSQLPTTRHAFGCFLCAECICAQRRAVRRKWCGIRHVRGGPRGRARAACFRVVAGC